VVLSPHVREFFFFFGVLAPQWAGYSAFTRFLDHTQRRTTIGRNPLDKWSARRRDLYLATHNTHKRQASMPPVGFKPTVSAGERSQTHASDRAATGTDLRWDSNPQYQQVKSPQNQASDRAATGTDIRSLLQYKMFISWIFIPSYGSGYYSSLFRIFKIWKELQHT